MITTEIYKGQGLGNQLWCYVVTRVIAKEKGYDFGIMNPGNLKCLDFMNLDFGMKVIGGSGPAGGPPFLLPEGIKNYYIEKTKILPGTNIDIRGYDKDLVNIPDNTKIDGLMQDEKYIIKYKEEIRDWLAIKSEYECFDYSKDDICVINFRGGEYVGHPDLLLPQIYWDNAMSNIRKINPKIKFVVITDDPKSAKIFFKNNEIIHKGIGEDYSIIKNAHYLILSNSSFAFFPAWLNKNLKYCIVPKYWARHNISDGYWSLSQNITDGWMYQDREGNLYTSKECSNQQKDYMDGKYKDSSKKTRDKRFLRLLLRKIDIKIINFNRDFLKKILKFLVKKIKINYYKIVSFLICKITISKSPQEIKEYRDKIKIYDIFTYNGEKEILEIRLNILKNYVDKFIIVEASTTFSGKPKPLYYKEQREYFKNFENKIDYFVVDDYPKDKDICKMADSSPNVPKDGPEHWRREFYQKESIKKALVSLSDDDICFIGDVDEIWNPDLSIDYTKNYIFKLKQKMYVYFLNNRSNESWVGTIVTKYKNIKNKCLNHLRTKELTRYIYLNNGGWHFSSMGGLDEIRRKLKDSYTSESYNTDQVQENLEKRFGQSDYLGRKFKFKIDESNLPKYIIENKNKYINLFKN